MDRVLLARELARFDAASPIEAAATPPASWYVEPDFLQLETLAVLRRTWQPVGRVDQATRPGDFFTGVFLGQPYVVVRDADGELRAFHNVCAHHAAQVACGQGRADELVCPYHGWTYALDGRLRTAPRLGRAEGFDVEDFGLKPIALTTWGPFVFLRFAECSDDDCGEPQSAALNEQLAPLAARAPAASLLRLCFVARREYTLRCNWKVYVDNYLDGGYHVAHLHRGLAEQLDLSAYRTEISPRLCIQSCAAGKGGASEAAAAMDPLDFAERIGPGATYAWLYPNFMINRYGPIMDTNWIVPLGADLTLTVFDYYFADTDGPGAQQFIKRSLAASHQVQEEDVGICESVQVGLGSGAYQQGRYAAAVEIGEYHFHRWLREDMEAYLAGMTNVEARMTKE